jgi:hypothetical protein
MHNREQLLKSLHESNVAVTFTKADGTERRMLCTLRSDALPAVDEKKIAGTYTDEVIRVWDLDNSEWRSFKVDSVKHTEVFLSTAAPKTETYITPTVTI